MNAEPTFTHTVHLSSGRGPAECERAVALFADWLRRELESTRGPAIVVRTAHATPGSRPDTYSHLVLEIRSPPPADCRSILSPYLGTVVWVCPSPYRKNHPRKNWFIRVSLGPVEGAASAAREATATPHGQAAKAAIDRRDVRFETCRSSGAGGQHVNKTETAVRAVHMPTGLAAVARDERSQLRNKEVALERLAAALAERDRRAEAAERALVRTLHGGLERGNAAAVFEGPDFRRVAPQ
jgi:peptide chain release factor